MDNSTHISLSLAAAMTRTIDVAANNIANANTAGFKGERSVFESYLEQHLGGPKNSDISFVLDKGSFLDDRQGALSQTNNPLDLALQGRGWLAYETANGNRAFGRDGQLTINTLGELSTMNGARVLDSGGGPITIPEDVGLSLTISEDGTISTMEGEDIAQIGIFDLKDIQAYERIGNGMFIVPEGLNNPALTASTDTKVSQGFIEQSNVQPIVEITRMMEVQKAYERAVTLMDGNNDLREQTLRRIGRSL